MSRYVPALISVWLTLAGALPAWGQEATEAEETEAAEAEESEAEVESDEETAEPVVDLEAEAEQLALEAAEVRDRYCSDVAGGSTTLAAQTLTTVGGVWARVSAHLEQSRKVYLLYWRGVLGQCLNQDERAQEDLTTFVEAREGDPVWESLVKDARRRLRLLGGDQSSGEELARFKVGNRIGGGIALASVAAVTGIGAAALWTLSQDLLLTQVYPLNDHGEDDLATFDASVDNAQAAAIGSYALMGTTAALGVTSILAFVSAGVAAQQGGLASIQPPVLSPTRGGVALSWSGRW